MAFSFGLLSLALAVASSLSGKLQEKFGVKKVITFSGLLLGASYILPQPHQALLHCISSQDS
ncbi:resistance protein [Vibrio sp. JCM 19236]|nr:resistance protein [Vibrio sp. JCM 19236]